jgi:hypothetical protein
MPSSASLTIMNGSMPTQQFVVVATHGNGTMSNVAGTWSLADAVLGGIDSAGGLFTSNGQAGGTTTVHVMVTGAGGAALTADAMLTVTLQQTLAVAPATITDAPTHFVGTGMTSASQDAHVVYPLDTTVMPQNVFPPDIQWLNGTQGDLYRITFAKPHANAVAYVQHTGAGFHLDWLVDRNLWRVLAQSDAGAPMTLTVDRWDHTASVWYAGPPRTVTIASGSVFGTVYYWRVSRGTLWQIDASGDPSAPLIPNSPGPPVNNDGTQQEPTHCIGCHSVSRDGRWLAGRLGGSGTVYDSANGGGVFDLTNAAALSANPAQYVPWPAGQVQRWYWSTWNHDGSALMINSPYPNGSGDYNYELRILHMNPATGTLVSADPSGATANLPRNNVAMPAWSADDSMVAFVQFVPASPPGERPSEFVSSSLQIVQSMGAGRFGAPVTLHDNHGATGQCDTVPTFSPDGHWIVYGQGNSGRSNAPANAQSALYIVSTVGGGGSVRLDAGNGGSTENDAWYASFSPFDSGGYFWLVYFSPRDYGNNLAGTAGSGRRQLWITAISHHPDGTHDPSHAPYWMPGQYTTMDSADPFGQNITAFWAPSPCRSNGMSCDASSECCSGNCLADAAGHPVCMPPPMNMCRRFGQSCSADSDCCSGMGLACINHVCDTPSPG